MGCRVPLLRSCTVRHRRRLAGGRRCEHRVLTLGNLTELVIALAALHAGEYTLVKASIAGAIVANSLFMLGASFFIGGLFHHTQEYNRVSARMQSGLLFLATIGLLAPSAVAVA